jgi:flotillin
MSLYLLGGIALGILVVFTLIVAIAFRRVVPTNMVHIVQSGKKSTSYGTGNSSGNVYYQWPAWLPLLGVTVIKLPVSNFDVPINDYLAYDRDRVPFLVDIAAFFRIADTSVAAQRIRDFSELRGQLDLIVKGAARTVLASKQIDEIMLERATFGEAFTKEVQDQLKSWGVEAVKNMELMDIRDSKDSKVIENIMAKQTSAIERDSRVAVAENKRAAEIAEIQARQATELREQEAAQAVGQRTAEKDREVGIAKEQADQAIKAQQAVTTERAMEVRRVEEVKKAEIERDKQVVAAEQDQRTTVIIAEGQLEAKRKEAEGIKVEGEARADAERAMQLAPVQAQITLAKEIGSNKGYQEYLVSIRRVEADEKVGIEQAGALKAAEIKVIANGGNITGGVKSVLDLLSSKGGTEIGAMLEGLSQTPQGAQILSGLTKVLGGKAEAATTPVVEAAEAPAADAKADGKKA